ncbi:TIGR00370 family protein [Peptostreptococcaceae bacterium AS15]|nr:TIGR00370 family protein [Peptostreptococcaceae bacterium AS15]
MYEKIKYLHCGESGIVMEFGNEISKDINAKIRSVVDLIDRDNHPYIIDILPTYRSVLIQYDARQISYKDIVEKLKEYENANVSKQEEEVRLIKLPTVYGGEYGPDIEFVANHNNLSVEEVIKIHTSTDYLVYMLGFIPGFTYLGGMSDKIATPRLASPRTKIDAGSVGIAGNQTGTYPTDSPGGWQIIGRTPLQLFSPESEPPVFINSGDYIRYEQISEEEFKSIKKQVEEKTYKPDIKIVKRGDLHE